MGFDAGSLTAHMRLDTQEFMDSADDVEEREDQLREDINVQIVLDKEQIGRAHV